MAVLALCTRGIGIFAEIKIVDIISAYNCRKTAVVTVATEVRHTRARIKCARAREKGIENRGSYE